MSAATRVSSSSNAAQPARVKRARSDAGASREQALAIPPPDGENSGGGVGGGTGSLVAAWLQPDYIPTFEVAYPRPKWYPVNEEISKEMYTAYLANTPGHYTEPLTANGQGGTREYIVDWEQMIQTNIENGRQRSVRFRPHKSDDTNQHHRRILTGKMR